MGFPGNNDPKEDPLLPKLPPQSVSTRIGGETKVISPDDKAGEFKPDPQCEGKGTEEIVPESNYPGLGIDAPALGKDYTGTTGRAFGAERANSNPGSHELKEILQSVLRDGNHNGSFDPECEKQESDETFPESSHLGLGIDDAASGNCYPGTSGGEFGPECSNSNPGGHELKEIGQPDSRDENSGGSLEQSNRDVDPDIERKEGNKIENGISCENLFQASGSTFQVISPKMISLCKYVPRMVLGDLMSHPKSMHGKREFIKSPLAGEGEYREVKTTKGKAYQFFPKLAQSKELAIVNQSDCYKDCIAPNIVGADDDANEVVYGYHDICNHFDAEATKKMYSIVKKSIPFSEEALIDLQQIVSESKLNLYALILNLLPAYCDFKCSTEHYLDLSMTKFMKEYSLCLGICCVTVNGTQVKTKGDFVVVHSHLMDILNITLKLQRDDLLQKYIIHCKSGCYYCFVIHCTFEGARYLLRNLYLDFAKLSQDIL